MKNVLTLSFLLLSFAFVYSQQAVTDISPDGALSNTYVPSAGYGMNINDQDVPFGTTPTWQALRNRQIGGMAFGDYDGDGDLDLAVGCYYSQSYPPINEYENFIFKNNNGVLDTLPAWVTSDERTTTDILWADVNMDGKPDLLSANGNFQKSTLYLNSDSGLSTIPAWISNDNVFTVGAAFCDIDGDGDLDLALANQGLGDPPQAYRPIQIFYNNSGVLSSNPTWSSADIMITNSVAFADINNGDLTQHSVTYFASGTGYIFLLPMVPVYKVDVVTVNGVEVTNYTYNDIDCWLALASVPAAGAQIDITYTYIKHGDMAAAKWSGFESGIYFNNNSVLNTSPGWTVGNTATQKGAAWADIDLDGFADLAIGGSIVQSVIYKNNSGIMSSAPYWTSNTSTSPSVQDIAFADVNKDGYPDLTVINFGTRRVEIFINRAGNIDTSPTWTYICATSATAIAYGDVNGDGWLDLAVGTAREPVMLFMADSSLIPVELSSFTAEFDGSEVLLQWRTSTEKNNYGFELERKIETSASSDIWKQIAFIPGNGTTTEIKSYQYKDVPSLNGKYSYRLKQLDYDGSFTYSHIAQTEVIAKLDFVLEQNYPNPFNPETKIRYQLPHTGNGKLFVSLKVYDIMGSEVASLVKEEQSAGSYEVIFNTNSKQISSGVYFYTLSAGDMSVTRKFVLSK